MKGLGYFLMIAGVAIMIKMLLGGDDVTISSAAPGLLLALVGGKLAMSGDK